MCSLKDQLFESGIILFKNLPDNDGNNLISPYSLTSILLIIMCGSRGDSRKQLSEALFGREIDDGQLKTIFKFIKNIIKNNKSINVNKKRCVYQSFMKRYFKRSLKSVNNN